MRRSIISLGDALRVCADLRPEDEETRQALRDLLGMEAETNTRAPVNLGAWLPSSSKNLMTSQRKATMEKERLEVAPPEKEIRFRSSIVIAFRRPDR